jgi:YegS/Rv2252/BmrU family lipid kinase
VKRYCLIANPNAGKLRKVPLLNAVSSVLDRAGLEYDLKTTTAPGLGITLAMEAASAGYRGILAFGGDGTVSEVASGVVGSEMTLGIIPAGTMNLFAREMGIPNRLEDAVDIIAQGHTRRVEVGKVGGRYFMLCASAGLDAAIVRNVTPARKRRWGKWAYYLAAPLSTLTYSYPRIRMVMDDGITLQGGCVVVSNGRDYGDGYRIAPGASVEDGVMDACLFRSQRAYSYPRYFLALRQGRHLLQSDVSYYKSTRFLLRPGSEGAKVPFQIDGDYLCDLPVEIQVLPKALPIYAPATV